MDTNDKKHTTGRRPGQRPQRRVSRPRKKPDVNVVYTEARVFNRNRFILQLVTVVAVVIALLLGLSIFFKAKNVVVSGGEKYSAWQVREASGLQDGENLLTVNAAKVSACIRSNLPYVRSVRVGIRLPDTVLIEIDELDVSYAAEATNGQWCLMDSNGKVVEVITAAQAKAYTQIVGFQVADPKVGATAVAAEAEPDPTAATGESTPPVVTVRGSDRLNAALLVMQALEQHGILGEVVSIDVSSISAIELWYQDRYQVQVGDTQNVPYKIQAMQLAINQSSQYQSGVLDVSFTIWPDQVGYIPF